MTRSVETVSREHTLRDAVDLLLSRHIRHLPVVDADLRLVGIVTDRDVKRATPSLHSGVDRTAYERVLDETRVAQFMTKDPWVVSSGTTVKEAARVLIDSKVGALPVVDDGRLVGIVSDIDLLRVLHGLLPVE